MKNIKETQACANCWGYQEYEGKVRTSKIDRFKGVCLDFISKFVNTYLRKKS